jgi:predicted transcriptional regulator
MSKTRQELSKTMRPYWQAQGQLEAARANAYVAIRKAHDAGMTVREIAEETQMSHQRIAQILKGER